MTTRLGQGPPVVGSRPGEGHRGGNGERDRESGCSGGPHEEIRPHVAGPWMPSQEPWTCWVLTSQRLLNAPFTVPSMSREPSCEQG